MKKLLAAVALAALSVPLSAAAPVAEPVPLGILSDAATPLAYRLDLTILPDRERFSGHAEIDATLKGETGSLFLHGRSLKVARVVARAGGRTVEARYSEVDGSGVARLDFASPLPAGKVTLAFDYDAAFGDGASGLYRVKVADQWYAWTQFESIDARAAFPGFDQPGYKTPFTVSVTTRPGEVAIGNSREVRTTKVGDLVRHEFEATKPLPTYLVAFAVGPFATATGAVPPTAERKEPLPIGIVGTQPYKDKLGYALENTGPIVTLLEKYFGTAFPFPKLDQIGSPVMPGAMENAGADIYGDTILLLDRGASTDQKKTFGMVVAHELSHQWFGDLVTPAWWDDLWLNESFANWMGYRIGNEWRPDLKIGAGAIDEAFAAMNVDALKAGRPIHQPIKTNGEIDSAFDQVTYGKGGQVVAMIAAYLGDEKSATASASTSTAMPMAMRPPTSSSGHSPTRRTIRACSNRCGASSISRACPWSASSGPQRACRWPRSAMRCSAPNCRSRAGSSHCASGSARAATAPCSTSRPAPCRSPRKGRSSPMPAAPAITASPFPRPSGRR
ncbi:M1 family metallopeptidase [Rhizorhabdus histidinilytica]